MSGLTADPNFWCSRVFLVVLRVFRGIMGCSGVLWDVPGVFRGCSRLFRAVPGVFRVLQTPHLELHVGNLIRSCSGSCTPQHTAAKTVTGIKLWWLFFVFSAGFQLSQETSSQRISCLVKIRDSFGFSF